MNDEWIQVICMKGGKNKKNVGVKERKVVVFFGEKEFACRSLHYVRTAWLWLFRERLKQRCRPHSTRVKSRDEVDAVCFCVQLNLAATFLFLKHHRHHHRHRDAHHLGKNKVYFLRQIMLRAHKRRTVALGHTRRDDDVCFTNFVFL